MDSLVCSPAAICCRQKGVHESRLGFFERSVTTCEIFHSNGCRGIVGLDALLAAT